VFAFATDMAPGAIGGHALAGFAGLAIGFALFAFGLIGGGDAKLFAGITLWLGIGSLLEFAMLTSLCGGCLALALISLRKLPMPASFAGHGWLMRLHDPKSGIPYGVALATGALVILPHTDIFRLAAG
jgi:prepilin peptidase CpaA